MISCSHRVLMIYELDRKRCRMLARPIALSQVENFKKSIANSAFGAPLMIAHMSNVETLARPRRFQTDCTLTGHCVENTSVIGCRHSNFAISQQLWWLRARFPPNNHVFDGVEFRECSVYAFVCCPKLRRRLQEATPSAANAISKRCFWRLAQAALAWEGFHMCRRNLRLFSGRLAWQICHRRKIVDQTMFATAQSVKEPSTKSSSAGVSRPRPLAKRPGQFP